MSLTKDQLESSGIYVNPRKDGNTVLDKAEMFGWRKLNSVGVTPTKTLDLQIPTPVGVGPKDPEPFRRHNTHTRTYVHVYTHGRHPLLPV